MPWGVPSESESKKNFMHVFFVAEKAEKLS
jgi:hypothetical protein